MNDEIDEKPSRPSWTMFIGCLSIVIFAGLLVSLFVFGGLINPGSCNDPDDKPPCNSVRLAQPKDQ